MIAMAKVRVKYVLTREGRRNPSSLRSSRNARFDEPEGFFPKVGFCFPNMEVIRFAGLEVGKKGKWNSRAFAL